MRPPWLAAVVLAAAAWLNGCSSAGKPQPADSDHGPIIRALVGEESGSFVVESKGGFRVESEEGVLLMRSSDPSRVTVSVRSGSTQLQMDPQGSAAAAEGNLYITPFRSANLVYAGVTYPGRILIQVDGNGPTIRVINVLPVETYLEGVLPHEIGDPGPDAFAAMEAQAITARTYALSRMDARKGEKFDVYAGVRDQVYRGRERTSRLASGAVKETRGMVLVYEKKLASAYYCATCGGHTSDIRRVWPQREPARYLYGILDRATKDTGSFCAWVHNYRWRHSFSGRELGRILRRTIPAELGVDPGSVGSLVDIVISGRDPSGRVRRLEVITTRRSFALEGDRIRWVLMPDPDAGRILPSTMFDLEMEKLNGRLSYVSVTGGGNGHGVGMCQNGAIEMARRGYTREMILAHYYPGTELAVGYGAK